MNFDRMFETASGNAPFPYQSRLAEAEVWPDLLEAPTGAGKTAAIVLAWLWRRRFAPQHIRAETPRRLVYCLPMRVLVEQTRDCVNNWLRNLGLGEEIRAYILMGGEQAVDWDLFPEREAILIGTQDMLLSRALNRGYGISRYRWPIPFGFINNDCQWVFDEVQLMGSGLATSAQLAAFRQQLGKSNNTRCLWVSATLLPDWLATVDFVENVAGLRSQTLAPGEWKSGPLMQRLTASKPLSQVSSTDKPSDLAAHVLQEHQQGSMTLVVVNTVKRARTLFAELQKVAQGDLHRGKKKQVATTPMLSPELVLVHSRFRPVEREEKIRDILATPPPQGRIVVSTQVIEAGVDISARTLFTDLAPWSSLVQRYGRCNRYGEYGVGDARVFWINLETSDKNNNAAPYTAADLDAARAELTKLKEVGPLALREHIDELASKRKGELYKYAVEHVLRRREFIDLFDTTADLSGNDIDISRYIRDSEELDVQVFWREITTSVPLSDTAGPLRQELCAVPIGEFRNGFIKAPDHYAFLWDPLSEQWSRIRSGQDIYPGQVFLIPAELGGYNTDLGWDPTLKEPVTPAALVIAQAMPQDATGRDPYVNGEWATISEHTEAVVRELQRMIEEMDGLLTSDEKAALLTAARWHDWGKAHEVFQKALTAKHTPPRALGPGESWAKAPNKDTRYSRPAFRHELASAMGMLVAGLPDLECYLVAAHHGKVRLSIRSLPNEKHPPEPERHFARGVWDGDHLPVTHLGSGEMTPAIEIPMDVMEIGRTAAGRQSWAERILYLRNGLGPFRLAYLEALLRAADMRASAVRSSQEAPDV